MYMTRIYSLIYKRIKNMRYKDNCKSIYIEQYSIGQNKRNINCYFIKVDNKLKVV